MRYVPGDTLLDPTGILPAGGSETSVFVDGGELTPVPSEPSNFYRAIQVRDFSCGGVNYVIVFTKSGLRIALHNTRGRNMLSRDSLEALIAAVDTLR